MTLKIDWTNKFDKDFKKLLKQDKDLKLIKEVINDLSNNKKLDSKYKDHSLKGEFKGFRDCHIQPDWILIYKIDLKNNKLVLYRTGSHSELF